MSTGRIIVYNLFVVVYLNLILIFLLFPVPKKQAGDSDTPINQKIYAEEIQYTLKSEEKFTLMICWALADRMQSHNRTR